MIKVVRNLLTITALVLFSLTSTGATTTTNKDNAAVVKDKKKVQEAYTLDGKKPKACDFRISLS
jgi:hypothetical protein